MPLILSRDVIVWWYSAYKRSEARIPPDCVVTNSWFLSCSGMQDQHKRHELQQEFSSNDDTEHLFDIYSDEDEAVDIEKRNIDSDFWAARGKREPEADSFWATRG